jgi:hypothetical protein
VLPQPATYGDLTKFPRYIDKLGTSATGELFWEDKGVGEHDGISVVMVAGTSSNMQKCVGAKDEW